MAQYIVPQFITVEDKILGPITVRQFIIILLTVGLDFVFFKLFDFSLFLLIAIPLTVFSGVLAFVNINGNPFHYFLLNFIITIKNNNIIVWQNNYKYIYQLEYEKQDDKESKIIQIKSFDRNRVEKLSKLVDTSGEYKIDK